MIKQKPDGGLDDQAATEEIIPASTKTAVFILNHNLPEETDLLYRLLAAEQNSEYDLFVLDNGSGPMGMAGSTTHRLERNVYWGGALNWAFRFIQARSEYDSLLFLNNDITLNPKGFVSSLRREMFSGNYQIVSPCIAGLPQPWPQMQCWYSGRTRKVRWIDMQSPLFRRRLIEHIGQFDEELQYGWGQELICARECENHSWATGIADHICIEHEGMATLKKNPPRKDEDNRESLSPLREYQRLARSAHENLIASDPVFFRAMIEWAHNYEWNPQKAGADIPESGFTRTDLINMIIDRRGLKSYLEIGIAGGENFSQVKAGLKAGVDPDPRSEAQYLMSSDRLFSILPEGRRFDLIFIDGLHEEQQVLRDIYNALNHLPPNGFVLVHDCNPLREEHQFNEKAVHEWCGTVWKAWARLRCTRPDLEMFVVDIDWGVGVIRRGRQETFPAGNYEFSWAFLEANRTSLLNLISVESFNAWLDAITGAPEDHSGQDTVADG